jgi:hypothetical protein
VTRLVFDVDPARLTTAPGEIPVLLYAPSAPLEGAGIVGNDLGGKFARLALQPSRPAMDLVAVAMAVTAADTFVLRNDAADGWRREFEIDLTVIEPDRWTALAPLLEEALGFLSGDTWSFSFRGDGRPPPLKREVRALKATAEPSKSDCVALFSGGLDSGLGVLELLEQGRRPLLVSHAARGDHMFQGRVAGLLPSRPQRFDFNSYPQRDDTTEGSTRSRSFSFLSVGALAAQVLGSFRGGATIDLNICENGLIALNPPLTSRRIGALSTRTAHPHYLSLLQRLFDELELSVRIVNPYRHETKGEMLARHVGNEGIERFASATISCGKWKRKNKQCGRCWPCIIRRASFLRAGIDDLTDYITASLKDALGDEKTRDDVLAVHTALIRRYDRNLQSWVLQSGPLPEDEDERSACFAVVERGMDELEAFFEDQGLKV